MPHEEMAPTNKPERERLGSLRICCERSSRFLKSCVPWSTVNTAHCSQLDGWCETQTHIVRLELVEVLVVESACKHQQHRQIRSDDTSSKAPTSPAKVRLGRVVAFLLLLLHQVPREGRRPASRTPHGTSSGSSGGCAHLDAGAKRLRASARGGRLHSRANAVLHTDPTDHSRVDADHSLRG